MNLNHDWDHLIAWAARVMEIAFGVAGGVLMVIGGYVALKMAMGRK